ncbi:helix-turn-helix transcriptional regulator [Paenibacillus sp. DMB5]|uniref:helix-turn-helix domain-containing protein n=1 Tax=Paenibacillus sp. DMB5 TaxID=1780103 RepID=UPI00076CFEFB|nr:helix-turn-helix transcriptional regulator [Paenibacillus sp. DMB5]KUP22437.1 Cro/Cl family transcriptional regulator [Paenibacillus sp. DMB5]
MIKNHVKDIMDRQNKGIRPVARDTGLAINTVSGLYHDTSKRVDFETLDKLCRHLNVGTGELIEYIEDEKAQP